METREKKRRAMWLIGIILAAIYFAPSILHLFTHVGPHPAQASSAQMSPAKPAAGIPASGTPASAAVAPANSANAGGAVPIAPADDPALAKFLGVWHGGITIARRGGCGLTLEIRASSDKNYPLAGYSTLGCMPSVFDLMAKNKVKNKTPIGAVDAITNQLNPTEAILAGSLVNGTLEFKAQKNIGVAEGGNNCPMSSISVTPFAEQIAVEWKESQQEGCMGGQMLMKRAGS
jgi:hypothetical protein